MKKSEKGLQWLLLLLIAISLAMALSSCEKSDGCGEVVGWYASGSGNLYLEVNYYGEVKRKRVSETVFIKAETGSTYCD